jgi:glycerophosphoryl diester phosphodiesterase
MVVAHRGIWHQAPENSLAAIEQAIASGAEIVEIDAQQCLSGEFVVIHDSTLERTTNGCGAVAQTSLEEIRSLRLRERDGGKHNSFTLQRLPLLSEVLECARGRIVVNIDAKSPQELIGIVAEVKRLNMQEGVIVKSQFDPVSADFESDIAAISQDVFHMPMLRSQPGCLIEDLQHLARWSPDMIELKFTSLEELHQAGPVLEQMDCRIWVNTLDPVHLLDLSDSRALQSPDVVWGALIRAGVGAIQTDYPAQLSEWLTSGAITV